MFHGGIFDEREREDDSGAYHQTRLPLCKRYVKRQSTPNNEQRLNIMLGMTKPIMSRGTSSRSCQSREVEQVAETREVKAQKRYLIHVYEETLQHYLISAWRIKRMLLHPIQYKMPPGNRRNRPRSPRNASPSSSLPDLLSAVYQADN